MSGAVSLDGGSSVLAYVFPCGGLFVRRKKDVCLHHDCENSEDSRLVGDDRVKRVRSNGQISNSKAVCFCLASGGTAIAEGLYRSLSLSILNDSPKNTKRE